MKYLRNVSLLFSFFLLLSCGEYQPQNKAVYLLIDTSGTYTEELKKAQSIINYLLATLNSGDSIAIARIDSGSFSEKDIIAKATFDLRPSTTNNQKRLFKQMVDEFVANTKRGSRNTDITGGLMQATDFVNETKQAKNMCLYFQILRRT